MPSQCQDPQSGENSTPRASRGLDFELHIEHPNFQDLHLGDKALKHSTLKIRGVRCPGDTQGYRI